MAEISINVDLDRAIRDSEEWQDGIDRGARDLVSKLTTLAESAMKDEAPEGTGRNPPSLRDSVETRPSRPAKRKTVMPRKRTEEGWLLVNAVVGNPTTPAYQDERPPPGPLLDWAAAKLGDEQAGWAIREAIFQDGHESFPNPFVSRSTKRWEDSVERVSSEAVRDALS